MSYRWEKNEMETIIIDAFIGDVTERAMNE